MNTLTVTNHKTTNVLVYENANIYKDINGTKYYLNKLKILGKGSYSVVYELNNNFVFKNMTSSYFFDAYDDEFKTFCGISENFIKEISALSCMKGSSYIIQKEDTCINKNVFGYTMKKYNLTFADNFELIILPHKKLLQIKKIIYQLLLALLQLTDNLMVHQDIKPENILFDKDLNVYLCDFSLVRFEYSMKTLGVVNSDQVQTLWYRAPEVLLNKSYNYKIDIWSIGIILLELLCEKRGYSGCI
jgi:serine/threonine protein kinase